LATKVAGYGESSYVPLGRLASNNYQAANSDDNRVPARLDPESILMAADASLQRLQTSYIDLYQLHWPDRYVPCFGSTVYNYDRYRSNAIPFEDTVKGIKKLLDQGKIKHWGMSNETTYGVCQLCMAADKLGVPRPVSIQNSFSLVHRQFETELSEACAPWNYNIGLLAWSPLAGGVLSGKYMNGARPPKARMTIFDNYQERFMAPRCTQSVEKYSKLAEKEDVSMAKMALAWIAERPYMQHGSTIIGATNLDQLKECIDAFDVTLSEETVQGIDNVHLDCRDSSQGI